MSCTNCSNNNGTPRGCKNNGFCASGGCSKLEVYDWLSNMEPATGKQMYEVIEVRFKNDRKEYFRNEKNLPIQMGNIIVTQSSSGHDVGVVSLTGELVKLQMQKKKIREKIHDLKIVYRKATESDIEKWHNARGREKETITKARKLADELGLSMKICDVEFQGDNTKGIFYYTAEERVDFRELIKKYADLFKVRVEMKQIGMRQEAGKLGGIGSCGRELCCSTWLTDFRSVTTNAARYQQLSLNPQKLAGQCSKLKCCLNFELDQYAELIKDFPRTDIDLKTTAGYAKHQKTDVFKKIMWYSIIDPKTGSNGSFIPLSTDRVHEIIEMNKKGQQPQNLNDFMLALEPVEVKEDYAQVVGQDSLTRFDDKFKNKKNKGKSRNKKRPQNYRKDNKKKQ